MANRTVDKRCNYARQDPAGKIRFASLCESLLTRLSCNPIEGLRRFCPIPNVRGIELMGRVCI